MGVEGEYRYAIRIVSFLLFVATVIVNYVIGLDSKEVSDYYSLFVTPPPMFFIIWAVIYISMAFVNIYNLFKNEWKVLSHLLLALNNLMLVLWINIFTIGDDGSVFFCFFVLLLNVLLAQKFWMTLDK